MREAMRSRTDARDEINRQFGSRIASDGWTAVSVDGELPYLYTVGLKQTCNHPELIVCVPPGRIAETLDVLDAAAAQILDGNRIGAGDVVKNLMGVDWLA